MIVADYYDISRLKMALKHEGVLDVEHQHVGTFRKEDVVPIGNAVVKLYAYVGKVYLMPAAEKMKQEAKIGIGQGHGRRAEREGESRQEPRFAGEVMKTCISPCLKNGV